MSTCETPQARAARAYSGTSPRRIRLAVLVSHPIQYVAPVYRALASSDDIDLMVIFHCQVGVRESFDPGFGRTVQWDVPLLDGYTHKFLSSRTRTGGLHFNVVNTLMRFHPDIAILHGYTDPTNLFALALCKLLGIKTLLRGDTRLLPQHKLQLRTKRWLKGWLLRRYDGCLAIGTHNRDYYLAHGVPACRIFHAPLCVHNSEFSQTTTKRLSSRNQQRETLHIPQDAQVVLYASKLTPRKRPADLLLAFARVALRYPFLHLLIAGAGEQELTLQQQARKIGLSERVKFLGFVNQSALPALYAASDIFVLPSQDEPWGLAVNEAMAAGLPVILTNDVGAALDLVEGKGTGIIYPAGDIAALADALARLIGDEPLRRSMGERASALIEEWDTTVCVARILEALRHSCGPEYCVA